MKWVCSDGHDSIEIDISSGRPEDILTEVPPTCVICGDEMEEVEN